MLPTRWAMLRFLSQPLLGTKKPPTQAWTVGSERRSGVRLRNDDDLVNGDVVRGAIHTVFKRLHTPQGYRNRSSPCQTPSRYPASDDRAAPVAGGAQTPA